MVSKLAIKTAHKVRIDGLFDILMFSPSAATKTKQARVFSTRTSLQQIAPSAP
jgi:hypothetical protein